MLCLVSIFGGAKVVVYFMSFNKNVLKRCFWEVSKVTLFNLFLYPFYN
jgi:hypothetical protein